MSSHRKARGGDFRPHANSQVLFRVKAAVLILEAAIGVLILKTRYDVNLTGFPL